MKQILNWLSGRLRKRKTDREISIKAQVEKYKEELIRKYESPEWQERFDVKDLKTSNNELSENTEK